MGRSDSINMDRPWSFHLPKGILFVIVEGLLITTAIVIGHAVRQASAFAQVSHWQRSVVHGMHCPCAMTC